MNEWMISHNQAIKTGPVNVAYNCLIHFEPTTFYDKNINVTP